MKPGRVANITTVQGRTWKVKEAKDIVKGLVKGIESWGGQRHAEEGAELTRELQGICVDSGLGRRDGAGWFVTQQEIWLHRGRRQTRCFDFILRSVGRP